MKILKGDYSYFNLSSLLRLLYSNKITGHLTLTRMEESVRIHFLRGKLVGLESARQREDPLEGLVDTTVWLKGEFNLETLPEKEVVKNLTLPPDQAILLLAKKEKVFKELKENLPSLDAVLQMNPDCKSGEIRLQPDEWNFLSKVDGKRTLQDLVYALDMSELSVFAITVKLIQKGILNFNVQEERIGESALETEQKEQKKSWEEGILPVVKVEELEKLFMGYVGPMGTIILDEILEGMMIKRDQITQKKLRGLIERMRAEIDSEEDRIQFVQEAIELFGLKE